VSSREFNLYATHLSLNVSGEITIRNILEVTLVASLVIHNVHVAVLVDPQLADYYVVDRRRHFSPGVVVT